MKSEEEKMIEDFLNDFNLSAPNDNYEMLELENIPSKLRTLYPYLFFFSIKNVQNKYEYFVENTNQLFIDKSRELLNIHKTSINDWIKDNSNSQEKEVAIFMLDFIYNYYDYYSEYNFMAKLNRLYNKS